jgi:hypothetical protein
MRSLDEIAGLRKTVKNTLGGVRQNCARPKKPGRGATKTPPNHI